VCEPQYPDRQAAARVLSLRASRGEYDIEPVIARLPPEQRRNCSPLARIRRWGIFPGTSDRAPIFTK